MQVEATATGDMANVKYGVVRRTWYEKVNNNNRSYHKKCDLTYFPFTFTLFLFSRRTKKSLLLVEPWEMLGARVTSIEVVSHPG